MISVRLYAGHIVRVLAVCMLLIDVTAAAHAAAAQSAASIYNKFVAKIHSMSTYRAKIIDTTVLQPVAPGSRGRTMQGTGLLVFKKPNLFTVQFDGLMGGGQVVSDGANQYTYSSINNEYFESSAPKEAISQFLSGSSDRSTHWISAGTDTVNGVPVYVITSVLQRGQGDGKLSLSIGKGDYLIYKSVTLLSHLPGVQGANFRLTKTDLFTAARINQPVASTIFRFTPPTGATKSPAPEGLGLGGGAMGF